MDPSFLHNPGKNGQTEWYGRVKKGDINGQAYIRTCMVCLCIKDLVRTTETGAFSLPGDRYGESVMSWVPLSCLWGDSWVVNRTQRQLEPQNRNSWVNSGTTRTSKSQLLSQLRDNSNAEMATQWVNSELRWLWVVLELQLRATSTEDSPTLHPTGKFTGWGGGLILQVSLFSILFYIMSLYGSINTVLLSDWVGIG